MSLVIKLFLYALTASVITLSLCPFSETIASFQVPCVAVGITFTSEDATNTPSANGGSVDIKATFNLTVVCNGDDNTVSRCGYCYSSNLYLANAYNRYMYTLNDSVATRQSADLSCGSNNDRIVTVYYSYKPRINPGDAYRVDLITMEVDGNGICDADTSQMASATTPSAGMTF